MEQGFQSPRTIAKWVTGAMAVYVAADVYQVVMNLEGLAIVEQLTSGGYVSDARLATFDQMVADNARAMAVTLMLCGISFCLWTYRVATNARGFGAGLGESPGWAVGFYFVPIASIWKPYQALAAVWRGSAPDPQSEPSTGMPWWFRAWWVMWLASQLADPLANKTLREAATPEEWARGLYGSSVAVAIDLIAVVLALTVLWSLTRRQEERAARIMPAAHVVGELA